MKVIKHKVTKHFTQIPNKAVRDPLISFRASGLHHYLLSLPDGWRFRSVELAEHRPEGRDAIRKALKELEEAGYVKREKQQDRYGQWSNDIVVSDIREFAGAGIPGSGGSGAIPKNEKRRGKKPPAADPKHDVAQKVARAWMAERMFPYEEIDFEWGGKLDLVTHGAKLHEWELSRGVTLDEAQAVLGEWETSRLKTVAAFLSSLDMSDFHPVDRRNFETVIADAAGALPPELTAPDEKALVFVVARDTAAEIPSTAPMDVADEDSQPLSGSDSTVTGAAGPDGVGHSDGHQVEVQPEGSRGSDSGEAAHPGEHAHPTTPTPIDLVIDAVPRRLRSLLSGWLIRHPSVWQPTRSLCSHHRGTTSSQPNTSGGRINWWPSCSMPATNRSP